MNTDKSIVKYMDLIEHDIDETLVCSIRKHPFGLLSIYFTGILVVLSLIIIGVFLGETILDASKTTDHSQVRSILYVVTGITSVIALIMMLLAAYIYQNNVILVTSDKIVQILYRNIVDRKISQLSLGDLQDVTVDQRGIFARWLGFGTLVIETAGEQNNFIFSYAPCPFECAKEIVEARENSIKKYGN